MTDYHDFLALAVPTDPLSRFTSFVRSPAGGGGVAIGSSPASGRNWQVWRSDSPASWLPAGPVIPGNGTKKTHADPGTELRAFLRVEVSIP